jgi:hypothetical protein
MSGQSLRETSTSLGDARCSKVLGDFTDCYWDCYCLAHILQDFGDVVPVVLVLGLSLKVLVVRLTSFG